jgi:hypothetical protein
MKKQTTNQTTNKKNIRRIKNNYKLLQLKNSLICTNGPPSSDIYLETSSHLYPDELPIPDSLIHERGQYLFKKQLLNEKIVQKRAHEPSGEFF